MEKASKSFRFKVGNRYCDYHDHSNRNDTERESFSFKGFDVEIIKETGNYRVNGYYGSGAGEWSFPKSEQKKFRQMIKLLYNVDWTDVLNLKAEQERNL